MRSSVLGKNTSQVEVQDISRHGIWLYAKGREFLLSFKDHPWFKDAKISEIYNVKLLHRFHLYWSDLDVDLDIRSLEHPEEYPLIAKMPNQALPPTRAERPRSARGRALR